MDVFGNEAFSEWGCFRNGTNFEVVPILGMDLFWNYFQS